MELQSHSADDRFDPQIGEGLMGKPPTGVVAFRSDPTTVWEQFDKFTGKLAFDVGANGGIVAEKLADNFDQVIAFEPAEESFKHLTNGGMPANVTTDPRAVSDVSGTVEFDVYDTAIGMGELVTGDSLAAAWGQATGKRSVEAVTLDELVGEFGAPDFVKIDTEGHEVAVVKGGERLLTEYRPRLLIEIHSKDNGEQIRGLLAHYEWERFDAPSYAPDSYMQLNHHWIVSKPSGQAANMPTGSSKHFN